MSIPFSLKPFKGILLDLDHTLYDYSKCHTGSIQNVFSTISKNKRLPLNDLETAFAVARKKVHTELSETAASHNRMLYFQKMFESLQVNALEYSLEAYNLYWDHFLSILQYDEGVEETLEMLSKSKKICLVTDLTAHIQHRKIQKLKLHKYVDFMVSSEEAGREKPHPYMFLMALKKLDLRITEVCMIGDNYSKDIIGANNLGIPSFWLNREGKKENVLPSVTEIKNFKDLNIYA